MSKFSKWLYAAFATIYAISMALFLTGWHTNPEYNGLKLLLFVWIHIGTFFTAVEQNDDGFDLEVNTTLALSLRCCVILSLTLSILWLFNVSMYWGFVAAILLGLLPSFFADKTETHIVMLAIGVLICFIWTSVQKDQQKRQEILDNTPFETVVVTAVDADTVSPESMKICVDGERILSFDGNLGQAKLRSGDTIRVIIDNNRVYYLEH